MGLRYSRAGFWGSFGPFAVLLAAIFLLAGCGRKESAPAKESAVLKSDSTMTFSRSGRNSANSRNRASRRSRLYGPGDGRPEKARE